MTRPLSPETAVLTGYARDDSRKNQNAPSMLLGTPTMPDHLGDVGRQAWVELTQLLEPMGILSADLAPLLESYCTQYAAWRHALEMVERTGGPVVKPAAVPRNNPWCKERDHARARCDSLLSELGLTPSGRSRIKRITTEGDNDDPFRELLARMTGRG